MAHADPHPEGDTHGAHKGHHIIPADVLLKVFLALLFLTGLTYLTAEFMNFGAFDVPLAIAIASTKVGLVVMFFMGLKYDNKVNTLAFVLGTIFVVVFLAFTLFDTAFRGDLSTAEGETIMDREAREAELQRRQEALDPEALRFTPADFEQGDAGVGDGDDTPAEGVPEEVASDEELPGEDEVEAVNE